MPDIIIKGMEMPSRCEDCFAYRNNAEYDYAYCNISSVNVLGHGNARLNDCPLSPAPEWISVEERLPEDEKPVVARYGFVSSHTTGQYFVGTLPYFAFDPVPHWQHESMGLHVTHWMPLPEPPEVET